VQGVYFRYHTRRVASSLGISGWVRNCPDGSVEAVAQGSEQAIETFARWLNQGPSGADVERVVIDREEPMEEDRGFRVVG
jgi:acylphosphatase